MLPQIVISRDKQKIDEYILSTIEKNHIPVHSVYRLTPEKKELSIDQIRNVKKTLITTAKDPRLIILESFHNATVEAQNALLKTLEEKNEQNIFILTASSSAGILPTVISRSKVIILDQLLTDTYDTESILLNKLLKDKSCGFLADPSVQNIDYERAKKLLEGILAVLKRHIAYNEQYIDIMKKTLQYYVSLERNNANPQLVTDSILLYIKRRIAIEVATHND